MNRTTSSLKKFIKGIPLVGTTASRLSQLPAMASARRLAFPGSAPFWESVYRKGDDSGPGSYGRLAEFKAEVLNEFVRSKNVRTVIEFGCGDGAQLKLAMYPEYVGVDVAPSSIARCSALFARDSTKRFYVADAIPKNRATFDLAMSLDVIFHLVEDSVFDRYMRGLFSFSERYVVVYASNYNALTEGAHMRHRKFTDWIAKNAREWQPAGFVANRFPFDPERPDITSHSDFHFFSRHAA
jgi:hypothetical protein